MKTPPNPMNTVTVSQKGKTCGEIRFHFKVASNKLNPFLLTRARYELSRHPDHQKSYYDVLLVNKHGKELDFTTEIL